MEQITFIVHGDISDPPSFGKLAQYPRTAPTSEALYAGRLAAMQEVTTPYFCLLDGGEDRLLPAFAWTIPQQIEELMLTSSGLAVSKETSGRIGHHAVVCSTVLAKHLPAPTGLFHFETMFYTWLRHYGVISSSEVTYDWLPSVNGARRWHDTLQAMSNSYLYVRNVQRTMK